MKEKRTFLAFADTGRDYVEFEFLSVHRANSKANINDAVQEYKRKHGHGTKVTSTLLIE